MINLEQIANIETILREFSPEKLQSGQLLSEYGMELTVHLSWTGEQMSVAKKEWRKAQTKAYESFVFSKAANGMEIKPQMAKDYVMAKCGDMEAAYERIERCHRSIGHTLDFLRSVMSSLREELKTVNYSSSFQQ